MPVLRSLRQGADQAMARSIGHLQTARDLLDLVTDQSLRQSQDASGRLTVSALRAQNGALSARLLRAWLQLNGVAMPPARRLNEFLRQIQQAREPFAQMDITDPQTGRAVRICRDREWLEIRR